MLSKIAANDHLNLWNRKRSPSLMHVALSSWSSSDWVVSGVWLDPGPIGVQPASARMTRSAAVPSLPFSACFGDRPEHRGLLENGSLSSLAENALDHADGNPIDPGDLGSRHAVLRPGADAHKLRARDLGRHPLLGADRRITFLATNWCRRQGSQNARFPPRLVGGHQGVRN
jgi:hypothetical protein